MNRKGDMFDFGLLVYDYAPRMKCVNPTDVHVLYDVPIPVTLVNPLPTFYWNGLE
jgi:hypothetical protein